MNHEWIFGAVLSCIGIIIGLVTALRRTFLFRTEFDTYKTERDKFADDSKQEYLIRLEELKKIQDNKCAQHRESCLNLHKKDIKLQEKELELRDQTLERLDKQFNEFRKEFQEGLKNMSNEVCTVKRMVETMLRKMNLNAEQ